MRSASRPRLEVVDDDQRVVGEEVQHGVEAGGQQRSERLGARRDVAAQQRVEELVDVAVRHLLRGGELADRRGVVDHQAAVGDELAGRRGDRVPDGLLGALARRVELADRLDLVAEELDANGAVGLRGMDVEDAAAHRELAGLLHDRHARVAGGHQRLDEDVAIEGLADLEVDRPGADDLPGGHAQGQGRPRGDDDGRRLGRRQGAVALVAREPPVEDVHALRDHEGLGAEALVGLGVVAREDPHARRGVRRVGLAERSAEVVGEDVAGPGVGDEHEHRPIPVVLDEVRDGDRARGTAKAHDARTALARGQPRGELREVARLDPGRKSLFHPLVLSVLLQVRRLGHRAHPGSASPSAERTKPPSSHHRGWGREVSAQG